MLMLSRRTGEIICIGDDIEVTAHRLALPSRPRWHGVDIDGNSDGD